MKAVGAWCVSELTDPGRLTYSRYIKLLELFKFVIGDFVDLRGRCHPVGWLAIYLNIFTCKFRIVWIGWNLLLQPFRCSSLHSAWWASWSDGECYRAVLQEASFTPSHGLCLLSTDCMMGHQPPANLVFAVFSRAPSSLPVGLSTKYRLIILSSTHEGRIFLRLDYLAYRRGFCKFVINTKNVPSYMLIIHAWG